MSDWDETFRQLQQKFIKLSEQRLKDMEKLCKSLEQVPPGPDGQALQDLMRHFHSLKGSGQSYGFPGVTQKCKQAQEECLRMIERKATPGPADIAHWRDLIVAVKLELHAPAAPAKDGA